MGHLKEYFATTIFARISNIVYYIHRVTWSFVIDLSSCELTCTVSTI